MYADIISKIESAMETGWFANFAEGPDGDDYTVEVLGGEMSCDSETPEALHVAEMFSESWTEARDAGRRALEALRRGDEYALQDAHDAIGSASAAEYAWGDDPCWGPVLAAIVSAMDKAVE